MKYPLLFLFSLLPAFLTSSQETFKTVTISVDIHEDFASLDDVTTSLGGTLTFNEETNTYTYVINEHEISLNLNHGYSMVNGEKEALFMEVDEETNLMTIQWKTPELIDEEIYVPIQYIERVLNATYEEDMFTFHITETINEEVVEQEEVDKETEEVETTPNSSATETSKPNQSTQTQKPTQTPSKPGTSESKPQQTPITPSQPESKPEDVTPTQPESKPEENLPKPDQPEIKPDDPVIENPEEEDTPSVDTPNEEIPSPDLPSDSNPENPESETTEYQNPSNLEIAE
ncbi:MAG: stalk domain-containing protein [Turicibacter sp.]|nr:stalk domain-containing protein [Turicibacter sp.]